MLFKLYKGHMTKYVDFDKMSIEKNRKNRNRVLCKISY